MTLEIILQTLAASETDFIVVGGIAAIFHGALETTLVVDVVHERSQPNRQKILSALQELDAVYREHLPKLIRPTLEHLASPGHMLLATREGPLDLLGTVSGGLSFEDLRQDARRFNVGEDLEVSVVSLDQLIAIKEATGRTKDERHLEQLRAARRLRDES